MEDAVQRCPLLIAALWLGAAAPAETVHYIVRDGIYIDRATYKGFLYYGDQCERCHGPEGEGGTFAPSLVESVRHMSHEKFDAAVMDGRKNLTLTTHNVMPSFKPNPDIVANMDNIYLYLKARADGALRRGHPEHLETR
jgi:mono/diheme cytochrome c family protein